MGRKKTDFTENRTNKVKQQKDESFDDILNDHQKLWEKGWYKGRILKMRKKDDYLIATADIFDLEDDTYYGKANSFLPICYSEDDLTAVFLEVFENPSKFSDVIGKEAQVYISFSEDKKGFEYPNICDYEKLE